LIPENTEAQLSEHKETEETDDNAEELDEIENDKADDADKSDCFETGVNDQTRGELETPKEERKESLEQTNEEKARLERRKKSMLWGYMNASKSSSSVGNYLYKTSRTP